MKCKRCKSTGRTSYHHVANGVCFACNGSGDSSKPYATAYGVPSPAVWSITYTHIFADNSVTLYGSEAQIRDYAREFDVEGTADYTIRGT